MRRISCVLPCLPRLLGLLVIAVGAAFGLGLPAAIGLQPAAASNRAATGGGEAITSYAITMSLRADASMHVRETITYDFGGAFRHGIERIIPVEFAYDSDRYRVYPLTNAAASSPSGAPADLEVIDGPSIDLRVGDPGNATVTGVQTYVLDYDVAGVVNAFTDHQELYWNAVGTQWEVPIADVSVTVEGPAPVQKAICFKGAQGSTDQCGQNVGGAGEATFTASSLDPGQAMTVVASFPAGTFGAAAPILRDHWSLARAFSLTPATGAAGLGLFALIGGGAAALVGRRGRDERYLGLIPGLQPGLGETERTSRVPLVRRDPVAVQFTPPKELRPGELGTLIDEQANVVDVTATIVDLAVRGFFTIHEVEQPGRWGGGDWNLVLSPTPAGVTADSLRDYELVLLNALFEGRGEVLLSQLKQTFRSDLVKVQGLLYDDVTRNGWFRGNPSSVRQRWQVLGFLVAAAGAGLTWLLAKTTTLGLLGIGVTLGGLVLLLLAPRMPARTAKGTALLAQARGFRLYLETAEAGQIKFEEGQDLFSRYLPYAIVFGVAERWAGVFAQLAAGGVAVATPTWYFGPWGPGLFDYGGFGRSVDSFSSATSGSIAAATPSSSGSSGFGGGGFSGGGGGGGGGGSW